MKKQGYLLAAIALLLISCTSKNKLDTLPSWNDTSIKQRLTHFLNVEVNDIPLESRIAVFDMDGTLICERPFGIETVVSIHRLLDLGLEDTTVQKSVEYQFAKKLSVNPRDTSVLNHCYENGQNYLQNIILKPFDGADSESYIQYANHCLNNATNKDYQLKYADMVYQPMLELIDALKDKQFQIYIVS